MEMKRTLMRVTGQDRALFLNDLLTISVREDMPMRYGALLSPQGKIETDVFVSSEGEALLLDLPLSQYATTKTKLTMYKLRAKVEFEDDDRLVYQIAGVGDPRGDVGQRVYGEGFADDLSEADYLSARVRACVPEFDADFTSGHAYPREWRFDEMSGIDYRKGCFVGQEIAARMRHKSELLKSVVRVMASDNLQAGTIVASDNKEIGEILSSSGQEALAFLRLKNLNPLGLKAGDIQLTLDHLG